MQVSFAAMQCLFVHTGICNGDSIAFLVEPSVNICAQILEGYCSPSMESDKARCSDNVLFLDNIPGISSTVCDKSGQFTHGSGVRVHTSMCYFLVYLHVSCKFLMHSGLSFLSLVYSWFSLQYFYAADELKTLTSTCFNFLN